MLAFRNMTNDVANFDEKTSIRQERIVIAIAIIAFGLLGIHDIYQDWLESVSSTHLIFEALVDTVALSIGAVLLLRAAKSRHRSTSQLRSEIAEARRSADHFKTEIEKFRSGITGAITAQLRQWGLTQAEEDVCLLLLKGFSLQEIADFRKTSERTIRHQASVLYKKTNLSGRAQLSAFFLEDLLVF